MGKHLPGPATRQSKLGFDYMGSQLSFNLQDNCLTLDRINGSFLYNNLCPEAVDGMQTIRKINRKGNPETDCWQWLKSHADGCTRCQSVLTTYRRRFLRVVA